MERGPFVYAWVVKGRDGEVRELGIRSYALVPAYNEDGEQIRYCPFCGEGLIVECRDCGRKVSSGDHSHCSGCGHYLWRQYAEDQPVSGDTPLNDDSAPGDDDDERCPF